MENAAPKVLRIDSRFRTSGTSSDFQYELPESIQLPDGAQAHISGVSFPYSWANVARDVNDVLYVLEVDDATLSSWRRAIKLEAGQYTSLTLPTLLQNALNAGTNLSPVSYQVSYVAAQGCLQIQLQGSGGVGQKKFLLPSEDELMSQQWLNNFWYQAQGTAQVNVKDPKSIGDLLRLPSTSSLSTSILTGLIDISPQHVLYLHSSLSSFNQMGPRPGERDVICRIPVDVSYGYVVHYRHSTIEHDTFHVGGQSLRNISFRLTNAKGANVDLQGGQLSIELIFVEPVI